MKKILKIKGEVATKEGEAQIEIEEKIDRYINKKRKPMKEIIDDSL
jgi:RecJ-like exonuclease